MEKFIFGARPCVGGCLARFGWHLVGDVTSGRNMMLAPFFVSETAANTFYYAMWRVKTPIKKRIIQCFANIYQIITFYMQMIAK